MIFRIEFVREPSLGAPAHDQAVLGRITLDRFSERFLCSTDYWGEHEYERQWQTALNRVLEGCQASALITSVRDPSMSNIVHWWPMYRLEGERVAVQNHILFLGELNGPFNPEDPFRHIRERRQRDEDGNQVSEWYTTVAAVRQFLVTTQPRGS